MAQAFRDQYAHYYDTTPSGTSETWVREGIGVEALSMAFNPQVDQYKQIIDRTASATFNGYQIQSSVSGKRIDTEDAIYEFVNTARKEASIIETSLLEVDMAEAGTTTGSYVALKYNVLLVINEFLGEDATISYDLYVKGSPVQGTATITGGTPTFTPAP